MIWPTISSLNSSSYAEVERNSTNSNQDKLNSTLQNQLMLTQKIISCYKGTALKLYGLPRIHKPTLSVRPRIPTSATASMLTDILTKAYDSNIEYLIKDLFKVNKLFNRKCLPKGYTVANIDVVSLFSNVHLDEFCRYHNCHSYHKQSIKFNLDN